MNHVQSLQNDIKNFILSDNSISHRTHLLNDILIDISFTSVDDSTLDDNSGKEIKGIFITDYSLNYTENTLEPSANDAVNQIVLTDKPKGKPF